VLAENLNDLDTYGEALDEIEEQSKKLAARASVRRSVSGDEGMPARPAALKKKETWKTMVADQSNSRIPDAKAVASTVGMGMGNNVLASSTRTKKTNRGEKIQI